MTQHNGWASSRVDWTIPATHAKIQLTSLEHPIRNVGVPYFGHLSVESESFSLIR